MTEPGIVHADVEIINQRGLHARAAAKFVRTAEQFAAEVRVSKGDSSVGGTSIMGLMMLAASPRSIIHIQATGQERTAVLEALIALIGNRFDED